MHWKKSITSLAVLLVASIAFSISVAAEDIPNANIMVNNQQLVCNVQHVYDSGTILVPAKELMNSIGGNFSFDSSKLTGILKKGENEIIFRLDNNIVKFNGKYIQSPAPMKIIGNRLMIPAQFVATKFGAESYMNSNKNILLLFQSTDGKITYQVQPGDTLWIISQLFASSITNIKQLNSLTNDTIYIGQKLVIKNCTEFDTIIPAQTTNSATISSGPGWSYNPVGYIKAWTGISVIGKNGDWYKVITPKGNGYIYCSVLSVKQDLTDTASNSTFFNGNIPVDTSKNYITYTQYTVQKGDTLWSIAEKNGMMDYELSAANNISLSTGLFIGQALNIPIHNIPVKSTVDSQYGEVLDWFNEAQYVFPINKVGKFIDIETGKSFMAKRTLGAAHSDTETLTMQDSETMKEIFGGSWTWKNRSFLLQVDGRQLAVSISGMPHAGIDGLPYLQNISNRSGDFGTGPNYDRISGNGMNGHFDVYFLNSLRHVDNKIDPIHQSGVMVSGGLQ
jgi:peptidoglycan DL-endopeptidase CwlS